MSNDEPDRKSMTECVKRYSAEVAATSEDPAQPFREALEQVQAAPTPRGFAQRPIYGIDPGSRTVAIAVGRLFANANAAVMEMHHRRVTEIGRSLREYQAQWHKAVFNAAESSKNDHKNVQTKGHKRKRFHVANKPEVPPHLKALFGGKK